MKQVVKQRITLTIDVEYEPESPNPDIPDFCKQARKTKKYCNKIAGLYGTVKNPGNTRFSFSRENTDGQNG